MPLDSAENVTLRPRPKLALWMFERDLKLQDAEAALGVSAETVRRYCLPFGNPARRVPRPSVIDRIILWTSGAIGPADFYAPASTPMAEAAQ